MTFSEYDCECELEYEPATHYSRAMMKKEQTDKIRANHK